MNLVKQYADLVSTIAVTPPSMARLEEPSAITDSRDSVEQYDRVMETNITVNYAASLDLVHRSRTQPGSGMSVLDLCSGPGHLSLCLLEHLGYSRIDGIDFSEAMVATGNKNARLRNLGDRAVFRKGNVLKLTEAATYDLTFCSNAAHHFSSLSDVKMILENADHVTKDSGSVVLTDLARLPSRELTEKFVELTGRDYLMKQMDTMYTDFLASMMAAWSPEEFRKAVPTKTDRQWFHIVSGAIPFYQALIGLPKGRSTLFIRESLRWENSGLFVSDVAKADWVALKGTFYSGETTHVDQRIA